MNERASMHYIGFVELFVKHVPHAFGDCMPKAKVFGGLSTRSKIQLTISLLVRQFLISPLFLTPISTMQMAPII
jgi:hypothetical protein